MADISDYHASALLALAARVVQRPPPSTWLVKVTLLTMFVSNSLNDSCPVYSLHAAGNDYNTGGGGGENRVFLFTGFLYWYLALLLSWVTWV